MTWLITGGSGQLGIALSEELDSRGLVFTAFGSKDLDITQGSIVRDLVSQVSPTMIINCAAWTDVDLAEKSRERVMAVNLHGAQNVYDASRKNGLVMFQISTDYVFGGNREVPWNAGDNHRPLNVYGKSKSMFENSCSMNKNESLYVFRTSWLYSEWRSNFVKKVLRKGLYNDNDLRIVNDQFGQPTSADDLATTILTTINDSLPFGVYHATNQGTATWYQLAREIFFLAELNPERIKQIESSDLLTLAKRPSYSVLANNTFSSVGAGEMRDWKSALSARFSRILKSITSEGYAS
jgi:dTDP-4-dehydrorhamnose reductase